MALQFNDETNENGIVQLIDSYLDTNSTSYSLKEKARDVNLASLRLLFLAMQAEGTWQVDDYNHEKDNIIFTNLVANQRDYHFITDEQGNVILDIYRVMVADQAGVFYDLRPVDQQNKKDDTISMVDGREQTGEPTKYDKTGNGIFLDYVPSYSYTNGLKVFISREHSYFTYTDTTKKLGFGMPFHEYLALRASYMRALAKSMAIAKNLQTEVILMEKDIKKYYSRRAKDEVIKITNKSVNPY